MHHRILCAVTAGSALVPAVFSQQQQPAAVPTPGPELVVRGFANGEPTVPDLTPDRIVVRFREVVTDPAAFARAIAAVGLEHVDRVAGGAYEVLRCDPELVDAWVAWLDRQAEVEHVERDALAHTTATPNDPFYAPYQWNLYDRGQLSNGVASRFGIQAASAWNTTAGAGIVVAVVDTGVAYENYGPYAQAPDLAGRTFVSPYDFVNNDAHPNDDNGHGTHVAGTVGQATNNGIGVAGIAYDCAIMPVKVLNASGSGSYSQIANGVNHAANQGADVVNLSLGGSRGSSVLASAIDYAWSRGVVICAATGNTGRRGLQYPAAYANCIAVGATRFDGARASYSTYGPGIDVVAPGGQTNVDQNGDGYGDGILQQTFASGSPTAFAYYFFQGTSMATPHVVAIAALVKANRPGYSNAQVRSAIEGSCVDLGKGGADTTYGNGLVDAAAALTR